ncbi:SRPBCC family protein [Streptomyces indicus]|uniref:Polyketide cyclase / dehydrase and lipid transport n=1 Tax=Streptomyces indicus TaxID=417292 RepID=A0A1G8UV64_9ACTN|nr:SRPBCC family protein [Streptomyces indicus]SDJ57629.1 Polyketide cyclase / dehydrase and lipid transport [Streptomyces indicus]
MSVIEGSVDVGVPVGTAYNQWTQFETFPRFMDGVQRVDKPQVTLSHWVARIAGVTREFDAKVEEQRPDELISWRSLDEPEHAGTVSFEPLDDHRCRVTYRLEFSPQGALERAGDLLGLVRRQVHGSLRGFKEYIEGQGKETGAWRGTVSGGHVIPHAEHRPRPVPHWPTG